MAVGVPTNEKPKDRKANGAASFNAAAITDKAAAENIRANFWHHLRRERWRSPNRVLTSATATKAGG